MKNDLNKLKKGVKEVLNKLESSVSKLGGFDFRSDLKNGEDSDQAQKRKGDRKTEIADATGIDVASGLSSGMSNNKLELSKVTEGFSLGDNINNAIDLKEDINNKESEPNNEYIYLVKDDKNPNNNIQIRSEDYKKDKKNTENEN